MGPVVRTRASHTCDGGHRFPLLRLINEVNNALRQNPFTVINNKPPNIKELYFEADGKQATVGWKLITPVFDGVLF